MKRLVKATLVVVLLFILLIAFECLATGRPAGWIIEYRGGHLLREGPWPMDGVVGVAWINSDVTDHDLRYAAIVQPQWYLDISDNPKITDGGVDVLCNISKSHLMRSIEEINVRGTSVTPDGIAKLKSNFTKADILGP